MATEKTKYEVTVARSIGGQWRAVDEVVPLSPAVAKYYLAPLGTGLKLVEQAAAKDSKPKGGGKAAD